MSHVSHERPSPPVSTSARSPPPDSSPCGAAAAPLASAAEEEEVPLEIVDYSCTTLFEQIVKDIETFLSESFQTRPELKAFLSVPVSPSPSSSPSATGVDAGGHSPCRSHGASSTGTPSSSSLFSFESDSLERSAMASGADRGATVSPGLATTLKGLDGSARTECAPLVVSQLFSLSRRPGGRAGATTVQQQQQPTPFASVAPSVSASEPSVSVEIHVWDYAHPVGRQFALPLFLLIQRGAQQSVYQTNESTFYLSMLATAAGSVFGAQFALNVAQGLDSAHDAGSWAVGAGSRQTGRKEREEAEADEAALSTGPLPSPHRVHPNCVPCFAPLGDPYKQTFIGCSPPLVLPLVERTAKGSSPAATQLGGDAALDLLLHQRVFSTRFLCNAYGQPPRGCEHLSDFLDLFQLHIGQRSRVATNGFDGVSLSVWKRFRMRVPWRFRPHPSAVTGSASSGAAAVAASNASTTSLTWSEVLRRENEALLVRCGPYTHPFGANVVPIECVLFDFQWNQLHEAEAQENASRSLLNPFALSTSANGKEANRKCVLTAHVLTHPYAELRFGTSSSIRPLMNALLAQAEASLLYASPTQNAATQGSFRASPTAPSVGVDAPSPRPPSLIDSQDTERTVQRVLNGGLQNATAQEALLAELQDRTAGAPTQDGHTASGTTAADLPLSGNLDALVSNAMRRTQHHGRHATAASTARSVDPLRHAAGGRGGGGTDPRTDDTKDLRRAYFPGSLLSRFAHMCVTEHANGRLSAEAVLPLWRRCICTLRKRFEHGSGHEAVAAALDCLALPVREPAVDLTQSLLVQKLQMLAYCLRSILLRADGARPTGLRHPTDGWDEDLEALLSDEDGKTAGASGDVSRSHAPTVGSETAAIERAAPAEAVSPSSLTEVAALADHSALRLITNGEVLCVPPSLPHPPATSDVLFQRAKRMNELGSSAVAQATRAWLQSDSLYNDMCLFLHVNEAHNGRVVRFADFIHWHSPRDFHEPVGQDAQVAIAAAGLDSDDAFLSERMQTGGSARSSGHVWASLWSRAVPRSKQQIIADCFRPQEEAALVFRWLEKDVTECGLLLEVINACIANATHRVLCHRFVQPPCTPLAAAMPRARQLVRAAATTDGISGVRHFVRTRCAALADSAEAAVAALSAGALRPGLLDGLEFQSIVDLYATALRHLDMAESSVSVALAVECLLGHGPTANAEGEDVVKGLSTPTDVQRSSSTLTLRRQVIPLPAWAVWVAKSFTEPADRLPRQMRARLTCMAERPLNSAECFQQLIVEKNDEGVLRLALALSQETI